MAANEEPPPSPGSLAPAHGKDGGTMTSLVFHCHPGLMPDAIFGEPRLAEIYDLLEPERPDLEPYLAMAEEFGARQVLDIGCGTGTFACMLAARGINVTAVDPAAASLEMARRKRFADRVLWVPGDASRAPGARADLVTMTANVAQVFLTDEAWSSTLRAAHGVLRSGGRLVFETRDPHKTAWRGWTRDRTYRTLDLTGVGEIETWMELAEVALPLVAFRHHFVFHTDGITMVSESSLRFRNQAEIATAIEEAGFDLDEIRDAPDRPGSELVFIAVRRG
jgi:ubiquinone/menaquinone biosynthesis C-methylase UbiE